MRVRVERLSAPFSVRHTVFDIPPHSYVLLPVVFAPRAQDNVSAGPITASLTVRVKEGECIGDEAKAYFSFDSVVFWH